MVTKDFDVVIVGAGAIGCSTALELAPDHDVLVLEKDC
ncbi:FAD-dependent oxidoreductase [Haloarculaceae archaeon H-GB2-1]|nr:FAD-dependent oxidoreductase [Haloarculaceae archaeon H-GB2-1]